MQGGDISNEVPTRVYIVWEGTLAMLPYDYKPARIFKKRAAKATVDRYIIDPVVAMNLWDIGQRLGVRFDLVTFLGPEYVEELQELIDKVNLPIATVWGFESPQELGKLIAFMPWVSHIIDHSNPMAYGGRASTLAGVRR